MTDVYRSTVIDAPIGRVWAVVRDFNALPVWTPFVADSRIEGGGPSDRIGCIRNFRLRDGGTIRERLLALDDCDHACTYAILESPMPVENYIARLALTRISEGDRTFAQWSATFDCPPGEAHALDAQIGEGVFAAAFTTLRQRFGGRT